MNIDHALNADLDDDDQREFQVQDAHAKQRLRKTIVLPDGKTVVRCLTARGVGKCDKTIASKEIYNGRVRLKIMLNPMEVNRHKPKILIEDEENEKTLERGDITHYLMGKCPDCKMLHRFCFEEIAELLGFASCEAALRTRLTGENYLCSDAENLAGGFLACFVTRKDAFWQTDYRISDTIFWYYADGEDDSERENS